MIITNLPLSSKLSGILKACATPLYHELNEMTVRDAKRYTVDRLGGPKAYVRVSISRHGNGSIRKLSGRLFDREAYYSDDHRSARTITSSDRFVCMLPYFESPLEAANGIGLSLVPLLIAEEVERRFSQGPRELVLMSDADLSELDACIRCRPSVHKEYDGATISEALLAAIVSREIEVRRSESGHERMDCIDRLSKSLEAAADKIKQERHQASQFEERQLWIPTFGVRGGLNDDDHAVLGLRRRQLPSLAS